MWDVDWIPSIGSQKAVFYDLDLPEVIALRRDLIPEQPDNVYIEASLLETDWMDDLRRKHPDAEFIFIVEGVLMYFYEKQVKAFLHHVASRFGGGELWFDVCGTIMSRQGFFFGQILGRIPWLCYKFSSLLGYKITSK